MLDGAGEPLSRKGENVGVVVIHGVGATEPGWINDWLVTRLQKRAPDLLFDPHSEVHRLPDLGRTKPGGRFNAYVRRARYGDDKTVSFIELYWNDLSKIGTGPITGTLAMMKLFYEAPQVLGESFLAQCRTGWYRVLRGLVLGANWLLRWPITGINAAVFTCAVVWLGMLQAQKVEVLGKILSFPMFNVVSALLIILAILAAGFARMRVNRDIVLTDIGLSTAIFSIVMLLVMLGAKVLAPGFLAEQPEPYLAEAGDIIFGVFFVWNHLVLLAIIALTVAAVHNVLAGNGKNVIPLERPAAALGMTIIQGIIWKILISLLWALIIGALAKGSIRPSECAEAYRASCTTLNQLNSSLLAITLVNFLFAIVIGLAFLGLSLRRSFKRRHRYDKLMSQRTALPRLIMSPAILVLLFAGTLLTMTAFYGSTYQQAFHWLMTGEWNREDSRALIAALDFYDKLKGWLSDERIVGSFLGGTTIISIYAYIVGAMREASLGILHIARDIVDHQYTPRFAMSRYLLPVSVNKTARHPRRVRIEKRLDVVMEHVVAGGGFDRLVFVAHSQGTVILYDYLAEANDDETLKSARRIDVLTLASPLSHLYQHYFHDYETKRRPAPEINPKLASWTNIWRIDDPIGNRIDIVEGDFVRNEVIRAGGHIDYWKETRVCEAILELIDPALGTTRTLIHPSPRPVHAKT